MSSFYQFNLWKSDRNREVKGESDQGLHCLPFSFVPTLQLSSGAWTKPTVTAEEDIRLKVGTQGCIV